jgi:hypothetical protein
MLVNVKPDTLIRWHRKGFRLFWRWKSKPMGRHGLPKNLRQLIRQMAAENVTWREERSANEWQLKLGIRVSPRMVLKYLRRGSTVHTPDPKQRWLTFVQNHANVAIAREFITVVTATFHRLSCSWCWKSRPGEYSITSESNENVEMPAVLRKPWLVNLAQNRVPAHSGYSVALAPQFIGPGKVILAVDILPEFSYCESKISGTALRKN